MEKESKHTETVKHTPTPYYAVKYAWFFNIQSVEGYDESDILSGENPNVEENAKFIVKACNNHYQLLELMKEVKKRAEEGKAIGYNLYNRIEEAIKNCEGK